VIVVAVRWYLRYGLSDRDIEELLVDRGVEVDHVTVYRWVQRFTPLLVDAARFARHSPGDRWYVDETYVKVNGVWRYVYRAVDQHGQVIDVLVSVRRDGEAARRFFHRALTTLKVTPIEVVTDAAPVYPRILDELVPAAWHHVEQYETTGSKPITADSNTGYDPCADGAPTVPLRSSSPGSRSCKISAAAITNSPPKQSALCGSPPRLPNSPKRSKQVRHGASLPTDQATQL
jgi:DDE domain